MNSLHIAAAVLLASAWSTANAQLGGTLPPNSKVSQTSALQKQTPQTTNPSTASVGVLPDNCTGALPLAGPGPYPVDNTLATTSPQGQNNPNCLFFGSTAIDHDVWFTWTATGTGTATLSMCGSVGTLTDPKIAVYSGSGCPTSTALACNDDFCGLLSQLSWCSQAGSVYTIQLGTFPGASGGTGTFTITVTPDPPQIGNDNCANPTAIAGLGTFPFDNSTATTTCAGQGEALCNFFGSTTVDHDVWFSWTAPGSGDVKIDTCDETTVDTKMAVYVGTGCPTSSAIACNDDACGPPTAPFQSRVAFSAVAGTAYTIQLGTFPQAPGGTGTFTISLSVPGNCDVYHDGTVDQGIGLTQGGEAAHMHRQGVVAGSTTVTSISTAWGDPVFGSGVPNGTPAKIAIWDDPNDDGNPIDCVLLQLVNTTVQNVDTNTLNQTVLTPAVTVNGIYFIGAGIIHSAGQFPLPQDTSDSSNGRAWVVGSSTTMNYNNLAANNIPPLDPDTVGLPGVWVLEAECSSGNPITMTCPGDGTGFPCPCGNNGTPADGRGCNNSISTGGGKLTGSGTPSLSADTLSLNATDMRPSTLTVLWQATGESSGAVFGDGVACLDGILKRIIIAPATTGSQTYTGISAASAAKGDTIQAGTSRLYHVFYRDRDEVFCIPRPANFNTTNGVSVLWGP